LIESMTRPQDWQAWLKLANIDGAMVAGGHRFDHLFVAIQAVKDGLGSLVAPQNILQSAIASRQLSCPFPHLNFPGEAYFAHVPAGNVDPALKRFTDWMVREAAIQGRTSDSAARELKDRRGKRSSAPNRRLTKTRSIP